MGRDTVPCLDRVPPRHGVRDLVVARELAAGVVYLRSHIGFGTKQVSRRVKKKKACCLSALWKGITHLHMCVCARAMRLLLLPNERRLFEMTGAISVRSSSRRRAPILISILISMLSSKQHPQKSRRSPSRVLKRADDGTYGAPESVWCLPARTDPAIVITPPACPARVWTPVLHLCM